MPTPNFAFAVVLVVLGATVVTAAPRAAAPKLEKMTLANFVHERSVHNPHFFTWSEQNDPVMGGQSTGNYSVVAQGDESYALFQGEVKNVSFLHAPGFCRMTTLFDYGHKENAGQYLGGALELVVKDIGEGVLYSGFKIAISSTKAARHHGGHELFGMYKANFDMGLRLPVVVGPDRGWERINIPLDKFSSDWSDFTGECATKDPDGYQHACCDTGAEPVCPTASGLSNINGLSVWAEGVEGPFLLQIKSISVVPRVQTSPP